jgi:hypothetical protein
VKAVNWSIVVGLYVADTIHYVDFHTVRLPLLRLGFAFFFHDVFQYALEHSNILSRRAQ